MCFLEVAAVVGQYLKASAMKSKSVIKTVIKLSSHANALSVSQYLPNIIINNYYM